MEVVVLGCGTSSGVPRIGGLWGECDPAEPRNRRRRVSILVRHESTSVLVDTGPDLREQLLDAGVAALDAVIWTHDHADHTHGIDDLRQVFHARGSPVPGYAIPETLAILRSRFDYVFDGNDGYPPTVVAHTLHEMLQVGPMRIRTVAQPHGNTVSAGLLFEAGGRSIGYSTDVNILTPEMTDLFAGSDLWIVDALRRRPHPSHASLNEALDWIAAVGPARALLTHMDQSMDYRTLRDELPAGVEPAYDGQRIAL